MVPRAAVRRCSDAALHGRAALRPAEQLMVSAGVERLSMSQCCFPNLSSHYMRLPRHKSDPSVPSVRPCCRCGFVKHAHL